MTRYDKCCYGTLIGGPLLGILGGTMLCHIGEIFTLSFYTAAGNSYMQLSLTPSAWEVLVNFLKYFFCLLAMVLLPYVTLRAIYLVCREYYREWRAFPGTVAQRLMTDQRQDNRRI